MSYKSKFIYFRLKLSIHNIHHNLYDSNRIYTHAGYVNSHWECFLFFLYIFLNIHIF